MKFNIKEFQISTERQTESTFGANSILKILAQHVEFYMMHNKEKMRSHENFATLTRNFHIQAAGKNKDKREKLDSFQK